MGRAIDHICVLVYNLALAAGWVYLVGWCDWSAWSFLGVLLLLMKSSPRDE